jgi:PAS domain S-box-containing protein
MSPPPSIVIADDASEVRLLIRTRLRLSGAFDVVGEAADGAQAVELAREHHPDLLLLDVSMPRMDGLEALPLIHAASPDTRVVVFSGFAEQGLMEKAQQLGAAAFVEKSVTVEDLIARLTEVARAPAGTIPGPARVDGASPPYVQHGPLTVDQHVLDEHLERFREVFDQAAIGMATMTLAGNLVRVNEAMARLLGGSADQLVGEFYGRLTNGREAELLRALDVIQADPVEMVRIEHGSAGQLLMATLAPVRDSLGRPLYVFLQLQDVTAERAAVAELRRSEERFRLLVEAVEDYAIFMLDPEGKVASWNAGAQRTQGYTAEEIIGTHFRVFYPEDVASRRHPEHELEVALREGHYEEEGWRIRKGGTRFYAFVVITAVHDDHGRHVGFAKVTRDITDRRAAEEKLRQSEQRFRLLVETVQDYAIFLLDPDGRVVSWNAGAQRSNGYTADEVIGRHFRLFYPAEVASRRHPEHELEVALRAGRYEEEGWRIRKDGSRFWANVVITPVRDAEGRHVGFAKVTRDTSERRRLEQEREEAVEALGSANTELEKLNERLRQAADDQAQFLAVTAHELRSPVGVLGSSAELLSRHWDELEEKERQDLFAAMGSSTVRLRRLLDDLLTASRLQASALSMTFTTVPVSKMVADAVATVVHTHPGAEVVTDVPEGLVVRGDRDRLAQALENLVANSLRHGQPPVRVEAREEAGEVRIRVRDAGAGVAAPVVPRLFERFSTGAGRGGTGLGLFIVRELARAHGGDAHYEAAEGAGQGAFLIALPGVRDDAPPGDVPSQ